LFLRLQLLHTFFATLIVLFLPFSVSVALCLLVYRVFFTCHFSRNYPRHFSVGGAFLNSGFTFSHYDLLFPTRYCVPYVRSGLYQLVICVKGIRVCALQCVRAVTSISHYFRSFRRGHHVSESRVLYRQRTDHVGCFCCRAIVSYFCCCYSEAFCE